jgi:hypothetical protein
MISALENKQLLSWHKSILSIYGHYFQTKTEQAIVISRDTLQSCHYPEPLLYDH